MKTDYNQPAVIDLRRARRKSGQEKFSAEFARVMRGNSAFKEALSELVSKAIADRLPPYPISHALEDQAKAYRAADRARRAKSKSP
jgi:hypothetical protein